MKKEPIKGVNLGGWLVLEKWITPSLFKCTGALDEYTFCKKAGVAERRRLKQFRDSFITKTDFEWLAGQGITAVRLPIGYWAFGNSDPYLPTVKYVDKAFAWAKQTGIKVLIDLHGAPGSQNGNDHSGRKGNVGWASDSKNIAVTLKIIQKIAERYGKHPALLGISLLNEPKSHISKAILLDYYEKAFHIVRRNCGNDVWVVYSDSFVPTKWRKALPRKNFGGVYVDTHHYQVFSKQDRMLSVRVNLLRTRWLLPIKLARLGRYHPVVVGEWSLSLGSNDLHDRSADNQREIARRYGRLQLQAYRSTAAWFFWTYKTEGQGAWNFRAGLEKSLLPSLK